MHFERETLLKPLQMVIGVVERKQILPILSNVLLNNKDNNLSITGTDLEVELVGQTKVVETALEETRLTLPGRKLMDICRALPDGAPIELYQDKGRVVLSSGKSRFTLASLPADDFPNIEVQEGLFSFEISQQDLEYLLHSCSFAMAHQDVRYYLNGMLFEVDPDKIRTVATDGHRLAMATVNANIETDHRIQIIIPRKGVVELQRLLSNSSEKLQVTVSSNFIRITSNEYTFTSKLLEGKFPDYQRVIPKKSDKMVSIDKGLLKQALQRAAILCNEKFRGLRFEFRENLLRIFANNPEQEAAEEEIAINYTKEELDIGFNVTYLVDILNILSTEDVALHFSDSNTSLLVEEAHDGRDSVFVVMPMRL